MAQQNTRRPAPHRMRVSVPVVDETVLAWWEHQDDPSASVRHLIRADVEAHGITDAVNRPLAALRGHDWLAGRRPVVMHDPAEAGRGGGPERATVPEPVPRAQRTYQSPAPPAPAPRGGDDSDADPVAEAADRTRAPEPAPRGGDDSDGADALDDLMNG